MTSIGLELPPHLLGKHNADPGPYVGESPEPSAVVGPEIPSHLIAGPSKPTENEAEDKSDGDDENDYGPALPPEVLSSPSGAKSGASLSRKIFGPSLPLPSSQNHDQANYADAENDDSDDDIGPMPLPAGVSFEEEDGVREFMEREERRRKQIEEAAKPKALKRDEWMLVPPSSSDLLGSLDPTKLKARQFARSAVPSKKTDNSLWTETPAERQQRIADEVSGKKRRAANAPDEEPDPDAIKRMKRDEEIRKGVEAHTRTTRGETLLDRHKAASASSKDKDGKFENIWDRDRDMSLGGRLMDEKTRDKIVRDARSLGDRFGTGKSGGFL